MEALICVYLLVFDGVLFVFGILSVFVCIFELEIPSVMYFLVILSYFVMFSFFCRILSEFVSMLILSWKLQVRWETRFVGGALTFGTNNWLSFELTPAN